jgi:hypothetical protein
LKVLLGCLVKGSVGAQDDAPFSTSMKTRAAGQGLHIAQDAIGQHDGVLRCRGDAQGPGGSVKQAHAQAFLQLFDRYADSRLCDVQAVRSVAQLAQVVTGRESPQSHFVSMMAALCTMNWGLPTP